MLCVFFLTRYALCAYARVAVYSACAEYAGKKKARSIGAGFLTPILVD